MTMKDILSLKPFLSLFLIIILISHLAKSQQVLAYGTFRITPKLWTQTFIISAQVTSGVFNPVVFVLLPDKKRDSYDEMFSMLAEYLESQDRQISCQVQLYTKRD